MLKGLKYISDKNGHKEAVIVPIQIWEELNDSYRKLQHKLQILKGIREGLTEVKQSKRSGKKLQTLKDFLK